MGNRPAVQGYPKGRRMFVVLVGLTLLFIGFFGHAAGWPTPF